MAIITFPRHETNLFAIVSQRGYCRIETIRDVIGHLTGEIRDMWCANMEQSHGLARTRSLLLFTLVDALSKTLCMGGCDEPALVPLVNETVCMFFKK